MTDDHEYNEEKVRNESILVSPHIIMHYLLPVLADEAYKHRYEAIFEWVKILGGGPPIRIIFIDHLVILVKMHIIVEQFDAE